MTEADQIVASLLEYDSDLDVEATVQRWKPEVRLLSTTVTARTGGKVEGFDVMLYGDKDPVYVGTIAPRGKNVWHTVHIMGNVTPLEMRQAAATWARSPEEAAQMLIDATKRSWEPVLRYQKAWAGLAESEGTVVFDELPRQLKVEIGEYLFDNNPSLKDHWSWEYVVQELDDLVDPVVLRVLRRPVQSVEDLDLTPLLKTDFKRLENEGFDPNFPVKSAFDAEDIVRDKLGESTDPKAVIDQEAEKAEEPKSEEHAEAGNYKKGHVAVQGLQITIENAKGSTRSGEDKNGKPWSVTIPAHYGYIAQVGGEKAPRGKDKDHIDVYIGPNPGGMMVYVVNQNSEEGAFDEHKCMLGFESKDEAIKTYDAAFSGDLGPKLRGEVVSVTMKEFKEWLKSGKTKKPFERLAESLVSTLIENDSPEDYIHGALPNRPRVYGQLKVGDVLYTETGAFERVEGRESGYGTNYQDETGKLVYNSGPTTFVQLTEFSPAYAYGHYVQKHRVDVRAGILGADLVNVRDNSDEALWKLVDEDIFKDGRSTPEELQQKRDEHKAWLARPEQVASREARARLNQMMGRGPEA